MMMELEALKPYMLSFHYQFSETYVVKQRDSLFWCFYILLHGYDVYETPGTVTFLNEKEAKFNMLPKVKESKNRLKEYNIHNRFFEIEDDLANNPTISIKTFVALCIAHDIPIFFVKKLKYFTTGLKNHTVVHYDKLASIGGYFDIEKMKRTYFKWDNLERPLKACSGYRLADLQLICRKMHFTNDEKLTKQQLYDILKDKIL
jgi:hypothetical protein